MITRIFFDLDETLLHTEINHDPEQECFVHTFDGEPSKTYYTIIRPCAARLVQFACDLVGKENVYVLTTSTRDYALRMNDFGKLGFEDDHIISRETIEAHEYTGAYGATNCGRHKLANMHNVLIDNLPPRYNESKCAMMSVFGERYIKVQDYYGVNFPNDDFEKTIEDTLIRLHDITYIKH